jgi:hypothetical protein
MADYSDKTKDELLEEARERDLKGRSGMSRDELQAALEADDAAPAEDADDDGAADEAEEVDGTKPETQVGHDSEASDPENPDVVENLSPEGQEALAEMTDEQAEQADLALDASGPLHLESPSERLMAGATSEEEAKEQEELLSGLEEDELHGNVRADGSPLGAEARQGSGENGEVLQEDVIDFPPPPAEVAEERAELVDSKKASGENNVGYVRQRAANEAFPDEGEVVAQPRLFQQRGQLYTDGLSGQADHNTEMAYRVHDINAGMFHVLEDPMAAEREKMEADRLGEESDED